MNQPDNALLESLRTQVQHNCHISDARHGTEFGLCSYLMKMREFFRWEQGLGYADRLDQDVVGEWLSEREHVWAGLADADYRDIELPAGVFGPFDVAAINRELAPLGLLYGAGIGRSGKPSFFLAWRELHGFQGAGTIYLAGRELARDLSAPPALSQGDSIFIRRESLGRMLWEKFESWRWHRPDNALGRAFSCYPFDQDLEAALEAMTEDELQLVLLHELGECQAGRTLGEGWNRMLIDLVGTPAEIAARAVRDFLADCLVTLPRLEQESGCAPVHFYMGSLSAMQRKLFPLLDQGYAAWREKRRPAFAGVAEQGRSHWLETARQMMLLHQAHGADAAQRVHELATSRVL